MNRTQKIIAASAGAALLVAGIAVSIVSANARDSNKAGEPSASPSPTATAVIPSASPTSSFPDVAEDDGDHEEEGSGTDGLDFEDDEILDTQPYRDVANAAVTAYATVIPGETEAARAKRLAPFFPAGSPFLTEEPEIANPQNYSGVEATVNVTRTVAAAIATEVPAGLEFEVITSWNGTYNQSGNVMQTIKTETFKVTMNASFDGVVQDIVEPTNLR